MIGFLATVVVILLLYIFSSLYLQYELYELKVDIKNCFKVSASNLLLGLQVLTIGIFGYVVFSDYGLDLVGLYKYMVVITLVFLAVFIDIKKRIIPNQLCLIMFIAVILFDCYQILRQIDNAFVFGTSFVFGGAIAFIVFFISMLLSRNGIGAGDVKLISIIGLCVGSTGILDTIFYILLAAFVYSIAMLIMRKVKLKDSFPMAPFIYIGLVSHFIMNLI